MENEQTPKYQNFISAQNFPEDPKNTRIRILYPKKYEEHTYHFAMKIPPEGQNLLFICRSFAFCMTKRQVEVKSRKTKKNEISHLWENDPHSSDEGNPYIKTNLHTGCLRKIVKKGEHKSPPEHTFIWRLA